MVYSRIQRVIQSVGAGTSIDYPYGVRGGILLSVTLTWKPRTFFNIGTDSEAINPGDIHVILGDASTSLTILGQDTAGVIVVPTNSSWSWYNPMRDEIISAAPVIEKLAFNAFTPMPIGVLRGGFRVIATWDPLKQVVHDLGIEAELLAFDANIT